MTLLEVNSVSKSFAPGTFAVNDVSFALEEGEILCLLGPSGCGKSTLLRMVAGLEVVDRGSIRFEGRDLAGVPPHVRDFGLMFQDFALFPHKNVAGNVAFGLRMRRLPRTEVAARVQEMLELVELAGFERREVAQLSGGEQQRVALARALAPSPQLLMLDEPLGALDRALRERLMLDVRAILKRVGLTAIYVTHDQTEAYAVSDRLAVMNAGRIEQLGPAKLVYERPATPFVARFLGFQNLVAGRADASGKIETRVGRFQLPTSQVAVGDVLLLIKPLSPRIEPAGVEAEGGVNQIIGTIDAVAFRGRFWQVWLSAGTERLLFEPAGDLELRPGDRVRVIIEPTDLQVYEAE